MAGTLLGVAIADGEAWARVWKSELLFAGCLSLATMTDRGRLLWRSRAFALGQLVDVLWMDCYEKSELLEALLLCSAMMTHSSVSCCAQSCRVGWLASGVLCLASRQLAFLYISISFVLIERQSSCLCFKKKT